MTVQVGRFRRLRTWVRDHWSHAQHRNAYYLMLNTVSGAAAGLLFWLLVARLVNLPPAEIGVGYSIIALGTLIAVLAKGGLDTALVRTVPAASRAEAQRLLGLAVLLGGSTALLIGTGIAVASIVGGIGDETSATGWILVGLIAFLLVVTWLQDAYFLAEGEARLSFHRNLVFSVARILLPIPIVLLAFPRPVAVTWAVALAASLAAALAFQRGLPRRDGATVPRRAFFHSALRNVSGSAAEFLPGLLLVPIVLAMQGPAAAAYFGIAWTAASLLFLASAAISRSAFAEMVRNGAHAAAPAIRRGARQQLWLILPAAVLGGLLAPQFLSVFGPAYAREGGLVLAILCLSAIVVAPSYFYLGLLRAREKPLPLLLFPAAMVAALVALTPVLGERWGLPGVAIAWLVANAPFGLYAAWRLRLAAKEVTPHGPTPSVGRAPHPE